MINLDTLEYSDFNKNFPRHFNWQDSFYAELTESGIWNAEKFWKLHRDIIMITVDLSKDKDVNRIFAADLIWLSIRINELVLSHFNETDVFIIENIGNDELLMLKERFDLAVIGVFSGELLKEEEFELVNPLIKQ